MPQRGRALTIFAILFWILALSDVLKPLRLEGSDTGLVFFGNRLTGAANAILGPLFGIFLAVYAYGIWTMRRFALPMAHAYATYVILNLIIWSFNDPHEKSAGYMVFGVVYAAVAIGVSLTSAVLLTRRKAELR